MYAEFHRPEMNGYWKIGRMDHYVCDHLALEAIFTAFNVGSDTDADLDNEAAEYRRLAVQPRSMSVGDVVVICRPVMDGTLRLAYRCDATGWSDVDDPAPERSRLITF